MESNPAPSVGFARVHAQLAALRDALDKLKKKARKTKRIIKQRKHRGEQTGADILGDILGSPFYLDQGGSLGQGADDSPFNPTMDTPLGDNPNNKP